MTCWLAIVILCFNCAEAVFTFVLNNMHWFRPCMHLSLQILFLGFYYTLNGEGQKFDIGW